MVWNNLVIITWSLVLNTVLGDRPLNKNSTGQVLNSLLQEHVEATRSATQASGEHNAAFDRLDDIKSEMKKQDCLKLVQGGSWTPERIDLIYTEFYKQFKTSLTDTESVTAFDNAFPQGQCFAKEQVKDDNGKQVFIKEGVPKMQIRISDAAEKMITNLFLEFNDFLDVYHNTANPSPALTSLHTKRHVVMGARLSTRPISIPSALASRLYLDKWKSVAASSETVDAAAETDPKWLITISRSPFEDLVAFQGTYTKQDSNLQVASAPSFRHEECTFGSGNSCLFDFLKQDHDGDLKTKKILWFTFAKHDDFDENVAVARTAKDGIHGNDLWSVVFTSSQAILPSGENTCFNCNLHTFMYSTSKLKQMEILSSNSDAETPGTGSTASQNENNSIDGIAVVKQAYAEAVRLDAKYKQLVKNNKALLDAAPDRGNQKLNITEASQTELDNALEIAKKSARTADAAYAAEYENIMQAFTSKSSFIAQAEDLSVVTTPMHFFATLTHWALQNVFPCSARPILWLENRLPKLLSPNQAADKHFKAAVDNFIP